MLSKVVGNDYGVSRNAAVTIVRLPQAIQYVEGVAQPDPEADFRYSTIVDALYQVLNDVVLKDIGNRAVINLSFGLEDVLHRIPNQGDAGYELYEVLNLLIQHFVVIVVASGNNGAQLPITMETKQLKDLPAVWGGALPLIVVGACDETGLKLDISEYMTPPAYPNAGVNTVRIISFLFSPPPPPPPGFELRVCMFHHLCSFL